MPNDKAPEPKWTSHHIRLLSVGNGTGDIIDAKTKEKVVDPGEYACPKNYDYIESRDMGSVMGRSCVAKQSTGSE